MELERTRLEEAAAAAQAARDEKKAELAALKEKHEGAHAARAEAEAAAGAARAEAAEAAQKLTAFEGELNLFKAEKIREMEALEREKASAVAAKMAIERALEENRTTWAKEKEALTETAATATAEREGHVARIAALESELNTLRSSSSLESNEQLQELLARSKEAEMLKAQVATFTEAQRSNAEPVPPAHNTIPTQNALRR